MIPGKKQALARFERIIYVFYIIFALFLDNLSKKFMRF